MSHEFPPRPGGRRVAILGGGPAALATAYHLTTAEPGRYDITIYEMSWRLGGKTASGRGADGRIEEHGLHVLFGGYHNTFAMMRDCYRAVEAECGPGALPVADFLDALVPGSYGVIGDDRFARWGQWDLQFPINGGVPGDPPLPTTGAVLSTLLQLAVHVLAGARALRWLQGRFLRGATESAGARARRRHPRRPEGGDGGDWCLRRVIIPTCRALLDDRHPAGRLVQRAGRLLQRSLHATLPLLGRLSRRRPAIPPRIWTVLDLVLATCRGLCRDRVLFRADGYSRLDRVELRAWLRHHGVHRSTLTSPFARVVYEATFQGFFTERIAAGAALRILLWMTLTYKGTMYYKMKGGTGDVLNLPLYLLLRQRGVRFAFFHKVTALRRGRGPAGDPVIEAVDVDVLARTVDGDVYDPLVEVGGHRSWPAAPVAARLRPEDRAAAARAEEFFQPPSAAAEHRRLRLGRDFDQIVFAIPVACIPFVCGELAADEQSPWRRQPRIEATSTVALQLWGDRSLAELGWRGPPPLLSLFWDPLNTWCDMGQVLACEPWPAGQRPRLLAYFCGPLAHRWPGPESARQDPAIDAAWCAAIDEQVEEARQQLFERLGELWPGVGSAGPGSWLAGTRQYLRANHDPHARCTLALPRQTEHRLRADDTGFANLTVAGDWTANHILVACLEGTVQSAIRAARAVSRRPELHPIVGERLLDPPGVAGDRPAEQGPRARRGPPRGGAQVHAGQVVHIVRPRARSAGEPLASPPLGAEEAPGPGAGRPTLEP